MNFKVITAGVLLCLPVIAMPVLAAGSGTHKGHDMSSMKQLGTTGTIPVDAVINKVNADKYSINVTHDAIPALKWPGMTMDMSVTRRVDLSKHKAGENVTLSLKQGRDKQYRIVEINPKE